MLCCITGLPSFAVNFFCYDGICTVGRMTEWVDGNILDDVLKSRSHANDLKFNSTVYGRRLKILEDIQVWGVGTSSLKGNCLDNLLADISGV